MDNREQPPALDGTDYETVARCLDEAIAVFDRRMGQLTLTELRIKSILSTVRAEMRERLKSNPQH